MSTKTLEAEPVALDRASRSIDAIRRELVDEHRALAREVESLLDTRWSGAAAGQFGAAWERWCEGMADVLSGLGLEGAALTLTRIELAGTDQERADAARDLHRRLADRLG